MRTLPTGQMGAGKQAIALGRGAVPVPGTAMRRGIGTAQGAGAGARPMTAVSGAGFSNKGAAVPGLDASITQITLEPKIETEEEKLKNLEKSVSQLAEESCVAYESNDKQAVRQKSFRFKKCFKIQIGTYNFFLVYFLC